MLSEVSNTSLLVVSRSDVEVDSNRGRLSVRLVLLEIYTIHTEESKEVPVSSCLRVEGVEGCRSKARAVLKERKEEGRSA